MRTDYISIDLHRIYIPHRVTMVTVESVAMAGIGEVGVVQFAERGVLSNVDVGANRALAVQEERELHGQVTSEKVAGLRGWRRDDLAA